SVNSKNGTPVLLRDLGTVTFGPDIREGVAEWQGEGEAVGGIIVMRTGENALNVINGIKARVAEIAPSLPSGVEIHAGYDRSGLISESIRTLQRDLLAECVIVSFVTIIFLFHFRWALIPILTLPVALLAAFIPMYFLHIGQVNEKQRRRILIDAAKQVGPALFFSLLVIVVSFLPVFLLEAQEGRMFRPLAWTKTLSVAFSSLLAITVVPALMLFFIRGRLRPEAKNPVSRITQALYLPIIRFALRHRWLTIAVNVVFLAVTIPLALRLGSQFMPPLFEGSSLYMPTSLPGIGITQATQLLQEQDRIIRSFPEVDSVFGVVGRSDSSTDNAPLDMYDTTVMLKPREHWSPVPGLSNTWTMPVENRLDMQLTGIKTPIGMKIQGRTVEGIQAVGARIEQLLSRLPEVRAVFAERVSQGFYLNIDVNRLEAARYGMTVEDVQRAVESGIGGENIAEHVEGRERYPINVRYQRDFRDTPEDLGRVLVATPSGAQVPLNSVARISFSRGPAMIRDEGGQLTGYVFIDLKTNDYGSFVNRANQALAREMKLPTGFSFQWSGEYEFQLRAKERLKLILPVVFLAIFMLLYLVFRSVGEALVLIFPTFYAISGGLLLQWLLGYNFSVAVWVGYIALFGIAVETGVVMVVYLHEALDRRIRSGNQLTEDEIEQAAIEGAVQRLRPKLMTVTAVLASLVPILWETGIGSDVMKPIAAPVVGGMITSTIHVLILVPVFFVMMKQRALREGKLRQGEELNKTDVEPVCDIGS
ncbi:MAG: CusA/CzcA family heavy metal efflux RND transporter, partial [Acidobacteria bacterium]